MRAIVLRNILYNGRMYERGEIVDAEAAQIAVWAENGAVKAPEAEQPKEAPEEEKKPAEGKKGGRKA